jgi:threonyl-tRNA synthetase
LWLTPTQAIVLPISDKFSFYANEVKETLKKHDIRVEIDERNEKIGRKIREAEMNKIPYMFVVGEKEMTEGKVAVRRQAKGDLGAKTIQEVLDLLSEEIQNKRAFE